MSRKRCIFKTKLSGGGELWEESAEIGEEALSTICKIGHGRLTENFEYHLSVTF